MENTTETLIKSDSRFDASGPGASFDIMAVLREHLSEDECNAVASRRTYLINTERWRPSDALRQAASEHLRGNVWRGCNA